MKYCANCGAKNGDTAKFCIMCGTKVEVPASPENATRTILPADSPTPAGMQSFAFVAFTKTGEKVSGTVTARNRSEAVRTLEHRGYPPISVVAVNPGIAEGGTSASWTAPHPVHGAPGPLAREGRVGSKARLVWALGFIALLAAVVVVIPPIFRRGEVSASQNLAERRRAEARRDSHQRHPGKQTGQAPEQATRQLESAKAAIRDTDSRHRIAAVKSPADQALLERVAIESTNREVRRVAIGRLTDQAALAKIALEDKDSGLSAAAVARLTDQTMLARIARESSNVEVRRAVARVLTDQVALADIALGDSDARVRDAAARKVTDQDVLAKIAMTDPDSRIRRSVSRKVADQDVLGKIAMTDPDSKVRRSVSRRVTDPAVWAKTAAESADSRDRFNAVLKITDQAELARIALQSEDQSLRYAATVRLTDQAALAKIALEDAAKEIRYCAAHRVTDQTVLATVLIRETDSYFWGAARDKITDQTLWVKIAEEAEMLDTRVFAIGKLTDQALLCRWAEHHPQAAIRRAVVKRIADDRFLIQRLAAESSAAVRTAIIETLHEKASLREVALHTYHEKDRKRALTLLSDAQARAENLKLAIRVVKLEHDETDSSKLLTLALEGEFDVLRVEAVRCLKDPSGLQQAALRSRDHGVLKALLSRIDDKTMLNSIASGAADSSMRVAAAQKSGARSWIEIFDATTASGASAQMLGDAVAAVSLFPKVQPDAITALQTACLSLIRRGDEARVPEMVDLLDGYGDKRLAEDYMNCGQPDLGGAGQEWAVKHGYSVKAGENGSHRAAWGSDR